MIELHPDDVHNLPPQSDSDRPVLHQSTDRDELVRQAKDYAKMFENGMKASTQGVKGARVESIRAHKSPVRLDEKIQKEGQPVDTIPDILAGRIEADSHEAHEKAAKGLHDNFSVVRDIDEFKDGDPDFHYRAHKIQVQVTPQLSGEVHIVPKEVLQAGFEQHADYQKAREADLAGDDKEEKQATTVARRINDKAMREFEKRNKMESEEIDGQGDGVSANRIDRGPDKGDGGGKHAPAVSGDGSGRRNDASNISSSTATRGSVSDAKDGAPVRGHNDGSVPKLARGVTVLIGSDSHGIVRGGNPNFANGGRWSVETPEGTKTFKGSELTPIRPVKAKDGSPWTGYDLDKSLSVDHGWKGISHIGKPTPLVEQAKKDIADGKDVRIFTARVAHDPKGMARAAVEAWSHRNIGKALPVTHEKDRWFTDGYDDRIHTVEPNTGKVLA